MSRSDFRIVHVRDPNRADEARRDYYAIEKDHWLWGWKEYGNTTYENQWFAEQALDRICGSRSKTVVE